MDNFKKNINKIIIVVSLVFIGVFIFNYVKTEKENNITEQVNENVDKNSFKIIKTLDQLEKISIDVKFFNKDFETESNLISFKKLVDSSSKSLPIRSISKKNPFLKESGIFNDSLNPTGDIEVKQNESGIDSGTITE